MRVVAIILANSECISAFFLKFKIHKVEIANFVTLFVYVLLLCENKIKRSQSTILRKRSEKTFTFYKTTLYWKTI